MKLRLSRFMHDEKYRTLIFAVISLMFNMLYSFYNGAMGIINNSIWFIVTCVYYLMLGSMRFSAILYHKKKHKINGRSVMNFIGMALCIMSFVLAVVLYFGMTQKIGNSYETITMITIATYTFTKIGMAVYKGIKNRHDDNPIFKSIRTIRYAEVSIALLSMQQAMLSSFGSENHYTASILNMITGICVCLFILALGICLLKEERTKK